MSLRLCEQLKEGEYGSKDRVLSCAAQPLSNTMRYACVNCEESTLELSSEGMFPMTFLLYSIGWKLYSIYYHTYIGGEYC